MRGRASLLAMAILGAGCTGDRPPAESATGMKVGSPSPDKPRCEASPGAPPEGFVMVRSREFRYRNHIAVREDYKDQEGRLLVYLLGVTGEMGEGAKVAEKIELRTGEQATLFGSPRHRSWSLVWSDQLPCPQLAVVANEFTGEEFLSAMSDLGLLEGPARAR